MQTVHMKILHETSEIAREVVEIFSAEHAKKVLFMKMLRETSAFVSLGVIHASCTQKYDSVMTHS